MSAEEPRRPPRRATYLLPTAFTVLNLFLGYIAIVVAFHQEIRNAALLIMISGVLDKLDGMIARATNTTSDFGRELDSLADCISFGLAPAILAYAWGLQFLGRAGWAGAFVFATCGALRLARFNVQTATTDKRFFVGLPIPMAAGVPVSIIFAHAFLSKDDEHLRDPAWLWAFLLVLVATALLMVSRVRYHSFKDVHFGRERRLIVVLALVAVIVAIAAWPQVLLPGLALLFAIHGPVMHLVPSLRGRTSPDGGGAEPA